MNQLARPPIRAAARDLAKSALSFQTLRVIAAGLDVGALLLAALLGTIVFKFQATGGMGSLNDGFGGGVIAAIFFVVAARSRGLYDIHVLLAPHKRLKRLWGMIAVTYLLLINILFLLKVGGAFSRGTIIVAAIFGLALVTLERLWLARFAALGVENGIIVGRRVVTVGEASELERMSPWALRQMGIEEVARIGVIQRDNGKGLGERGRGQIASAIGIAREFRASEFVLLIPWEQGRLMAEVGDLLRISPLPVRLLPDYTVRNVIGRQRKRGLDATLGVELQRAPLRQWERLSKRALDLSLSIVSLILLSPLLMCAALAVKLDSKGPVLFRQRRCGFDDKEFVIFKFRTMSVLEDGANVEQATRSDPRVTRIGRLLRRSSLDELPQLFNVILGDMSLVGPRPHAMAHHDRYASLIGGYALRHHVKPGLTGMAQIHGLRGETRQLVQMERRVEQDLWYINHWSLALDVTIMARTCFALFRQEVY